MRAGPSDALATAELQTETEHDKDKLALEQRSQQIVNGEEYDEKTYHGLSGYAKYHEHKDAIRIKGAGIT